MKSRLKKELQEHLSIKMEVRRNYFGAGCCIKYLTCKLMFDDDVISEGSINASEFE